MKQVSRSPLAPVEGMGRKLVSAARAIRSSPEEATDGGGDEVDDDEVGRASRGARKEGGTQNVPNSSLELVTQMSNQPGKERIFTDEG